MTTTNYPAIRPSDIAKALQTARPDLYIETDAHGPGGLTIIAARDADSYDPDGTLLFGTAGGHLGWSDGEGEKGGGWETLVAEGYEDWNSDEPVGDGMIALARIAGIIAEELPEEL